MVACRSCGKVLPIRSFLLSPGLSVADVQCPFCRAVMRAGKDTKRAIWAGLIGGGLFAAIAACGAHDGCGWNWAASVAVLAVVAILTGAALTAITWLRDDFHADK